MAALATMCRNIEASHDRDIILEPLSFLKNTLPIQPAPLLLPSDSASSPLKSTRLAGQLIACFVVGGECRLCLPQLLAMVLPTVSEAVVQKGYAELQIHTAIATPTQMESLKISGILPPGASTCSLIRKSDAERLVSRLLPQSSGRLQNPKLREDAVTVCHDGFGGCTGLLIPSLVVDECSAAIECMECKLLFTGETFVSHTHATIESNQICHWGFDTANWRYYIYLAEEFENNEDGQQKLQLFKNLKEIEAQRKLSVLLNSQIRAIKRRIDPKLEEVEAGNSKATKFSKVIPENMDHGDETKKPVPLAPTNLVVNQLPPLSFQNLQLLLAYQNFQAQLPLFTLPQQLAKLASLSLSTPVFPQNSGCEQMKEPTLLAMPSAVNLSETSTAGLNLINKLLNGIHSTAASESRRVEPPCSSVVPSLDKLLEDNLSVNVYALARTMLEEERASERQKRQQLEAQVEQLQILVEQLRRGNSVYQNVLAGQSLQDVRNVTTKTAIF